LPPLLEPEASLAEVRRLLLTAALLEREALDVEARVRLRLEAEVEGMLRRLGGVLPDDEYRRVLDILSVPDEDEREN
jgi:hypothetical protein